MRRRSLGVTAILSFLGCAAAFPALAANISINEVTVTEGQTAVLTVSLDARVERGNVRVDYTTEDGTAAAGQDYVASSGRVQFRRGDLTQEISVQTIQNTVEEGTETFTVVLSNPSRGDTITDNTGVVTILDDDQPADQPPTCQIDLPTDAVVTVSSVPPNNTVNYAGTVSDPNATILWTFEGGDPATRDVEDPGLVTYNTAGDFTTTLVATNAAGSCDPQIRTVQVRDPQVVPNVSINSTSQSCGEAGQPLCSDVPAQPGFEQPAPDETGSGNTTHRLLTINDLGMHCGDLDTRVASILPPFNVLHTQVVRLPTQGISPTLNPANVSVFYSAASNPNDPFLTVAPTRTPNADGVFKTNFWDIALQAYDPFYPPGILPAFYPQGLEIVDLGLPVPNVERLYLEDGVLEATQQSMPSEVFRTPAEGPGPLTDRLIDPYQVNEPQLFQEFVGTQPFFINFAFGYTAEVNWYEAAGIPLAAFDDFGRENPYPLMRVQAVNDANGAVLATTDTVTPISAEADCQICHAAVADGGNGSATQALIDANIPLTLSIDDPEENAGTVPLAASVEWASDNNILKLHDLRHGTTLVNQQPVVCQRCHYTPALDLAQVGPNDVNGREQSNNKTMSNVMHSHHATVTDVNGQELFPLMPPPSATEGPADPLLPASWPSNQATRLDVLDQTCYRCHPGDRTQCLRGAMFNGGMLCQDCHGDMAEVGNDFSRSMPGGTFELAADFYTNPDTPRVPWANEPGCGSCHTGDFSNQTAGNLAGTEGTIVNATDIHGNPDGIRLIQAFRSTDLNKKPIVPDNKRFAEDVVDAADNPDAAGNPKLYRVSTGGQEIVPNGDPDWGLTGHGGLFCEACHGSTHAEWPNQNPNANDNQTAIQLQGHTGTVIECQTCHGNSLNTVNTNNGPHGMHPVGNDTTVNDGTAAGPRISFVDGGHENVDRRSCSACHGEGRNNNQGTVLSVAKKDRRLNGQLIPAGTPVGCGICHD